MNIPYTELSDIFINKNENITDNRLNLSFQKLYKNDVSLVDKNKITPSIWECKWFNTNDSEGMGYSNGDAVWLNTEDTREFINHYSGRIYDYARSNSYLRQLIVPYNKNDSEIYELYKSILSGYYDELTETRLSPLFEIGDLMKKPQIRISKIDNNKHSVYDDEYWRDFFVYDASETASYEISTYVKYVMDNHISVYHMNDSMTTDQLQKTYLYNDMSNIDPKYVQKFESHEFFDKMTGFDYMADHQEYFTTQKDEWEKTETVVERIEEIYKNKLFFGKTNSEIKNELSTKLKNCHNYRTDNIEGNITDIPNGKCLANIKLNVISGYNFIPNQVDYKDISVLSEDRKKYYDVSFNRNKYYPLSTSYVSDIEDIDTEYDKHSYEITKEIVIKDYMEYQLGQWYTKWNSGLLEQGGTVKVNDRDIIDIILKKSYDYKTTDSSFYGNYDKFYDCSNYNKQNNLTEKQRYTVSLTPIFHNDKNNDDKITTVEINTITNSGFKIKIPSDMKKPHLYRYYVRGFVEN